MRKRDREAIVSLIVLLIIVFKFQGAAGVLDFIKNMWMVVWALLIALNQATIELSGDSILVLLFSTTITFAIVGILLEVWNIPRGKLGHFFGKLAFWLIGFPVVFILNIIGRMIFN